MYVSKLTVILKQNGRQYLFVPDTGYVLGSYRRGQIYIYVHTCTL